MNSENGNNPSKNTLNNLVNLSVAIVDDDKFVLVAIEKMLSVIGLKPLAFEKGEEFINFIRQCNANVDFVMIDIQMPIMSGVEICDLIRREFPLLKIILMTGHPGKYDLSSYSSQNDIYILYKPFGREKITEAISKIIS
jgi:FixJ family two-component response regulator